MRNVHFKGIHIDKWVFGDLLHKDNACFIGTLGGGIFQVADETVSQFTGVLDSTTWEELSSFEQDSLLNTYKSLTPNEAVDFEKTWKGIPIYENDILNCRHIFDNTITFRGVVKQHNGCFGIEYSMHGENKFMPLNDLLEYNCKSEGSMFKLIRKPNDINIEK